jgi:hypothetical protein
MDATVASKNKLQQLYLTPELGLTMMFCLRWMITDYIGLEDILDITTTCIESTSHSKKRRPICFLWCDLTTPM